MVFLAFCPMAQRLIPFAFCTERIDRRRRLRRRLRSPSVPPGPLIFWCLIEWSIFAVAVPVASMLDAKEWTCLLSDIYFHWGALPPGLAQSIAASGTSTVARVFLSIWYIPGAEASAATGLESQPPCCGAPNFPSPWPRPFKILSALEYRSKV